eukprot:m.219557 g.219557  ORF g.219557 m.219557 type:complete len:76 (-) comp13825_c11_seq2:38-265(-)
MLLFRSIKEEEEEERQRQRQTKKQRMNISKVFPLLSELVICGKVETPISLYSHMCVCVFSDGRAKCSLCDVFMKR